MQVHVDDILIPGIEIIKSPNSPGAEAYRTLNTNIQFSTLDIKLKTLVITSSGPNEGKSTVASNLACAIAEAGHRTILMDCDLRCPKLHRIFLVSNVKGITNTMLGELSIKDAVQKTSVENLYIITSGMSVANPAAIIASSKMKSLIEVLKLNFEYIIIDTPPVIPVTDAQILSSYCDGCIIVASSGETETQALKKTKELLKNVKANIIGVVLNKIDGRKKEYYNYYYYNKKSANPKSFSSILYKFIETIHNTAHKIKELHIIIKKKDIKKKDKKIFKH